MSLLVALSGHGESDARLLADATALAEAGRWDMLGVHVGAPEDVAGLAGTRPRGGRGRRGRGAIVRRAAADEVELIALGLRTVPRPGLGSIAQCLAQGARRSAPAGAAGDAPDRPSQAPAGPARGEPVGVRGDALRRRGLLRPRPRDRHAARHDRHRAHPSRAACRRRASSTRSSTSGHPGRRSSRCASRSARGAAGTASSCGSAIRSRPSSRRLATSTPSSSSSRGGARWPATARRSSAPCSSSPLSAAAGAGGAPGVAHRVSRGEGVSAARARPRAPRRGAPRRV